MKKILSIVLICMLIVVFTGCEEPNVGEFVPIESETVMSSARFHEIGREAINSRTNNDCLENAYYYVDIYTNIVYVYFIDLDGNATRGMMTVLYNADGIPMTLEEFMN